MRSKRFNVTLLNGSSVGFAQKNVVPNYSYRLKLFGLCTYEERALRTDFMLLYRILTLAVVSLVWNWPGAFRAHTDWLYIVRIARFNVLSLLIEPLFCGTTILINLTYYHPVHLNHLYLLLLCQHLYVVALSRLTELCAPSKNKLKLKNWNKV